MMETKIISKENVDQYTTETTGKINSIYETNIRLMKQLNRKLANNANIKTPERAYWNMLRDESHYNKRAYLSSLRILIKNKDSLLPYETIHEWKLNALELKFEFLENRFYLMHETDFNSRLTAMESMSKLAQTLNKMLISNLSKYYENNPEVRNYNIEFLSISDENLKIKLGTMSKFANSETD